MASPGSGEHGSTLHRLLEDVGVTLYALLAVVLAGVWGAARWIVGVRRDIEELKMEQKAAADDARAAKLETTRLAERMDRHELDAAVRFAKIEENLTHLKAQTSEIGADVRTLVRLAVPPPQTEGRHDA